MSSRSEKKDKLEGLQAGADDYLTKPFDADELQARLFVGERILRLQDELISGRDALEFQATHDPLTGLVNCGEILVLDRARTGAQRTHAAPGGVIMCDIDHFKKVNDTYGHLTGDVILRGVAQRLTSLLRGILFGGALRRRGICDSSAHVGCYRHDARGRTHPRGCGNDEIRRLPSGDLHMTMSLGVAIREDGTSPDTRTHAAGRGRGALSRQSFGTKPGVELAAPDDFAALVSADGTTKASRHG